MSLIQTTGRDPLFRDLNPLEQLIVPKDKHVAAIVRGLFGITTGAQVRELWAGDFYSARVKARLSLKYEPVARALDSYPGLAVRTLPEAFETVVGRELDLGRGRAKEDVLVTSTFPEILANAMNVSFLRRYLRRDFGERTISTYGRATDTRPRKVVQLGAYTAPLPTVAENGLYTELGPLLEAAATFVLSKKGALQSFTFELFKNDNGELLRRMVEALADLARVTFAQAVWAPWLLNSLAPDGVAWFHASHNNIQTGVLDETNLIAAITKLGAQAPLGSTTALPSPAQPGRVVLVVGPVNWDKARKLNATQSSALFGLFNADASNILINPLITDASWGVHRPSEDSESLRTDFMDGNEEPELLLSDQRDAGMLFSHDRYLYRVRHWYGVGLVDHRGAVKSTGV